MLDELRAGWREVRSRTWVWVTIAVFTGAVLCVYAQWYALAPVIARDVYGGAGVFGLLESVAGVGAVCGALARDPLAAGAPAAGGHAARARVAGAGRRVRARRTARARGRRSRSPPGFGFSLLMIWWETALARHIPPRRAVARQRVRLDGVARAAAASAT